MRVISIIGWGRSGSTLLDRMIGSVPGAFSTGELRYLDERLLHGGTCGCGAPVRECPVWSAVLARAESTTLDPDVAIHLLNRFARARHTQALLRMDSDDAAATAGLSTLVDHLDGRYAAIETVSGAQLIVDSSKFPSHAALLRLIPSVEPFFVQLVRDPRAVAYSWSRPKESPDHLPRYSSVFSSAKWVQWNLACEKIKDTVGRDRYVTVRYEDLVADPRATLARLLAMAGHDADADKVVGDGEAALGVAHTISGNPDRFVTGPVKIREDSRWHQSLPVTPWSIATTLTAPLLPRYGYRWQAGAPWRRRVRVA